MPGKAKYCEHCKGYGGLFVQVIKRFGDDRIKERYPEKPAKEPCEPCKGSGMISIETDKVPVFSVDEQSSAKVTTRMTEDNVVYNVKTNSQVETNQENADMVAEDPGADIDVPSEAPEPTYQEDEEENVIEEEDAIDDEPVDKEDPIVFEETPTEGEMQL